MVITPSLQGFTASVPLWPLCTQGWRKRQWCLCQVRFILTDSKVRRPTISIAVYIKGQETQGWALAASLLGSPAPSAVDKGTHLDPLPMALCLGALDALFPQLSPSWTRHRFMLATALGDSQSATHIVCMVLPSQHLRRAMLPLGTPSLEHTTLFYKS